MRFAKVPHRFLFLDVTDSCNGGKRGEKRMITNKRGGDNKAKTPCRQWAVMQPCNILRSGVLRFLYETQASELYMSFCFRSG